MKSTWRYHVNYIKTREVHLSQLAGIKGHNFELNINFDKSAATLWNNSPGHFRNAESICAFKTIAQNTPF